jgi:hypothetical protein
VEHTTHEKDFYLDGSGVDSCIVSTARVYHTELTSDQLPECNTTKCWANTHRFEFFGDSECAFKFACDELTGFPCGSYKLALQTGDAEEKANVCHQGIKHEGSLKFNEDLEVSLWYTSEREFSLSCYFWCTTDGELPQPAETGGNGDGDNNPIEVVSSTTYYRDITNYKLVQLPGFARVRHSPPNQPKTLPMPPKKTQKQKLEKIWKKNDKTKLPNKLWGPLLDALISDLLEFFQ